MGFEFETTLDADQSSEKLKDVRETLKADLQAALSAGDGNAMLKIDAHLKDIDSRIFIAEMREAKASIEQMQARQSELADEITALQELKVECNRKLGDAAATMAQLRENWTRVDVSLALAENEKRNLRTGILTYKTKLDAMRQTKLQEMNYE